MKSVIVALTALVFAILAANPAAATVPAKPAQLAQSETAPASRAITARRPELRKLSAWDRVRFAIRSQQQKFYRALAKAVKEVKAGQSFAAIWSLVTLSFLYGVFHAAGPGHGKAVISAYLLANERQVRRGITLAFLSSLVQALSAIALVSIVVLAMSAAGREAQKLVGPLETASYALVCAVGLYMLWRAVAPGHGHAHAHDGHDHEDDACGHTHMPTPAQIGETWSLTRALSIVFAVGIRPCSGAVLVLLFANAIGLYAAGIGATFAMSLGTALTVSALAVLTLFAKNIAIRLVGGGEGRLALAYKVLAITGSLLVFAIGLVLLIGSWGAPRPFV